MEQRGSRGRERGDPDGACGEEKVKGKEEGRRSDLRCVGPTHVGEIDHSNEKLPWLVDSNIGLLTFG